MPKSVEEKAREAYESEYGRTSDGKIIYVKDLYSGGFDEFLEIFRRDYNAEGGLIKRVKLRGGKDAAQSDFDAGPGEVSSDAGFDNTGKSQVTEINIGDAPTVFDINKVGDPSQNPKSINVRGGIDYTPSFASPPSFKDNIVSKGKSFVKFVSPFLVNAAFGTFVPSKVKKGIALFNLAKNLDTIQDMVTEDVLEEDVALTPDGREEFRFGSRGYQGSRSSSVDRGPSARDRAMGSGGKRKGGTNTRPGGGGNNKTKTKSTKGPSARDKAMGGGSKKKTGTNISSQNKKSDLGFQLAKLAALGLDVGPIAETPTTTIYSGTTSKNPFGGTKFFATPDLKTAKTYATTGPLRGSPFAGPVTGKVLSANVPTSQVKNLTKRGLTGTRELVLDPNIAKEVFTKGSGNIKGASNIGTKIAKAGFRAVPGVGTGISLADAASRFGKGDVIGGTLSVAGAVPGVGIPALGLQVGYDALKNKLGLKDGGQPKKIPIRSNKYGVKELDYRKSGGFVPIGVKEKADDVPAMLSKNEFVFTADAVRGAGNGSINKGAQKMYNLMKNLEARRV